MNTISHGNFFETMLFSFSFFTFLSIFSFFSLEISQYVDISISRKIYQYTGDIKNQVHASFFTQKRYEYTHFIPNSMSELSKKEISPDISKTQFLREQSKKEISQDISAPNCLNLRYLGISQELKEGSV